MTNMNLYSRGDRLFVIVNMVLIGLFTISTLYPFIYIASMSMSTGFEARAGNVILTPVGFTLEAYKQVLSEPLFWSSYANTFIYTIGGTLMSLAFIIPGAYALSKPQLYGRRFWNLVVAFTMWFNAGLIPFFLNMRDLGLLDSYFGIIIGFAVNGFNIILLRNFFEGIPRSFEEAARMDGMGFFRIFWSIVIPLSWPGFVATGLIVFIFSWNEFPLALVLMTQNAMRTAPVGISLYPGEYAFPWETISTATVIAIVPIPLVPPWTSRVSPSRAQPRSKTLCHTVNSVSGIAAASSIGIRSGTCRQWPEWARQYSA